uniref:Uncharacterized protein n=2 Tax=Anguilla anguilla TaxID=7936 RepID=A0A0E9VS64_ANGAN
MKTITCLSYILMSWQLLFIRSGQPLASANNCYLCCFFCGIRKISM